MSEHTLGLMRFREQGEACEYCLVTDDNRWVISFRLNGEFMPQAQQDIAIRIVASMNACAGISDEALADDCVNKMREDRDQLLVQRDDLLAAAVAVVDRWDSPKWIAQMHTGEFINNLREAIAKGATP